MKSYINSFLNQKSIRIKTVRNVRNILIMSPYVRLFLKLVGWLVGGLVSKSSQSVGLFHFPCSYQSTCLLRVSYYEPLCPPVRQLVGWLVDR